MAKKMKLAIVQSRITQFDEPLYKELFCRNDFDFMVYYTIPLTQKNLIDPEIGELPSWHTTESELYPSFRRGTGFIGGLSLLFKILTGRYDLVIISGYNSGLFLLIALACRISGIPTGLRTDNVMLYRDQAHWKWRLKKFLYPLLLKIYSTSHPTGSLAAAYLEHFGVSKNDIFYFPYNVDNKRLECLSVESKPKQEIIRHSLGIKISDRIVLGILKFVQREDPLTLFDGFELISREHSDLHLILVGDGELRKTLEDRINAKGMGNVHLVGYVQYADLPCYFGMADIFVHPGSGSWEVSVNEAMACGVPVIASDHIGSAYDLIEPNKTGYIFQMGSPTSLAEKLRLVLEQADFKGESLPHLKTKMAKWNYDQTINNLCAALLYINSY